MRRSAALLAGLALAGCQLTRTSTPAPTVTEAPRATFGGLIIDVHGAGRSEAEWRGLVSDEVLAGGWVVNGGAGPTLQVSLSRRSIPNRLSEALHVLTLACYPRSVTLLVRAAALAQHEGGLKGASTATVRLERLSSLGLFFYPPAWGLEPSSEVLERAVREATRAACSRLAGVQANLSRKSAADGQASPAQTPAACPACAEPVEADWIVCPRCAAELPR